MSIRRIRVRSNGTFGPPLPVRVRISGTFEEHQLRVRVNGSFGSTGSQGIRVTSPTLVTTSTLTTKG